MISLAQADAQLTVPGSRFEILEGEIRGVRTRVWKHAPRSLREILEQSREHGDRDFLVYQDDRLTFQQHWNAVCAFAAALERRFGVRRGDRVAIAMRNYPEWSVAFWATTAIGAIAVPLNAWWVGEELEYGLTDSGSKVLVADGERVERLRGQALDLVGLVVVRSAGEVLPASAVLWEHLVPADGAGGPGEGVSSLPRVDIDTDDDATIFYTSGTTGFPKGALGTHRNICSNYHTLEFMKARGELRTGNASPPASALATLLTVPFFHVTGCHSTLVPSLAAGSKLVLLYKFDPEETLRLIERERVTSFGGVPTLVWKVLESEAFSRYDTSSVLRIGYGGAPAAPELVRRIQRDFPQASPSNGYGLTESSSVTTSNAGDSYLEKPDSVGPATPVCELRVVDDAGDVLPAGGVGELWIKGPNIIKGYWNKPEATADTFTDGWLHSGDIVRLDADGFVYIVDRAKDVVIRGGENVYSVEVETALFEHPEVIDAAVYGVPHRVLGEEVAASVQVRRGSSLDAATLRDFLRSRLAAFKAPAHYDVGERHFPQNASGKTLKSELRKSLVARSEASAG